MTDKKAKNCVVVIPAFNEEASLPKVLNEIPKDLVSNIVVVDNGSTDNTAAVAKEHGAVVVYESKKGYGQACLSGMAKAKTFSPDIMAFLDADYSDNPEDLRVILSELENDHDLVIGSRTRGNAEEGALLPQAIFGNWLSTKLMRWLLGGYPFTDLGPFRAIRTDALEHLDMNDKDFGWTVEMQAKALLCGLRCSEVSVNYKKRIGISKITGTVKGTFLAGYKILGTIGYLWLKSRFKSPHPFQRKIK